MGKKFRVHKKISWNVHKFGLDIWCVKHSPQCPGYCNRYEVRTWTSWTNRPKSLETTKFLSVKPPQLCPFYLWTIRKASVCPCFMAVLPHQRMCFQELHIEIPMSLHGKARITSPLNQQSILALSTCCHRKFPDACNCISKKILSPSKRRVFDGFQSANCWGFKCQISFKKYKTFQKTGLSLNVSHEKTLWLSIILFFLTGILIMVCYNPNIIGKMLVPLGWYP